MFFFFFLFFSFYLSSVFQLNFVWNIWFRLADQTVYLAVQFLKVKPAKGRMSKYGIQLCLIRCDMYKYQFHELLLTFVLLKDFNGVMNVSYEVTPILLAENINECQLFVVLSCIVYLLYLLRFISLWSLHSWFPFSGCQEHLQLGFKFGCQFI